MRKRHIILRLMIFVIIFLAIFVRVSKTLENKYSYEKYAPFFEEQRQFDVIFFGSSHILTAMSPMDLWNDYGITSYNFANSNERLATTFWVMRNAFDYNKPKMIVLDVGLFYSNVKYEEERIDLLHDAFDCFPLSLTKIRAFNDILGDNQIKYEFLFDIGKYHSRWEDLGEADFKTSPSWQKGNRSYTEEYMIHVFPTKQNEIIYDKQELSDDMVNVEYLKKIIDTCQKEGIEVVLVHTPYVANYEEQAAANSVSDIAAAYSIPYINFVPINKIIDMNTDLYNSGHVNASGMKKLTDYMGNFLTSHYAMEDHRQDPLYSDWKEYYNIFIANKKDVLIHRPDLYSYLMLLHDKTYSCYIYINKDSPVYEDENAMNLLQNIGKMHIFEDTETTCSSGQMVPLENLKNCMKNKESYLGIIDNGADKIIEIMDDSINYFDDTDNQLYDVQIAVIDVSSNEIVDVSKWGGADHEYTERSNE